MSTHKTRNTSTHTHTHTHISVCTCVCAVGLVSHKRVVPAAAARRKSYSLRTCLCASGCQPQMAQSFVERGLTVAPWRRTSAMLSKWLPVHAKDTPFATTSVFHAPPPAEDVWLPFGAEGAGSPRPSAPQQQQQQPQPQQEQQPASTCPFAEVRRRREQEDLARQMATLAAWCSMQASPRCITSIVAPAATAQAGKAATATDPASAAAPGCNTFAATTAAAGGSAAVAPADCSACAAAGNAIDPGPPFPTSPRSESSSSCSSSSSSGGRRTSLLSTQLHQQVCNCMHLCICASSCGSVCALMALPGWVCTNAH